MIGSKLVIAWKDLEPSLRPLRRQAFALGPLVRTIRLGAPIGAQLVLEFGMFGVVALLMGRAELSRSVSLKSLPMSKGTPSVRK